VKTSRASPTQLAETTRTEQFVHGKKDLMQICVHKIGGGTPSCSKASALSCRPKIVSNNKIAFFIYLSPCMKKAKIYLKDLKCQKKV
jgi:hypothetical protein